MRLAATVLLSNDTGSKLIVFRRYYRYRFNSFIPPDSLQVIPVTQVLRHILLSGVVFNDGNLLSNDLSLRQIDASFASLSTQLK